MKVEELVEHLQKMPQTAEITVDCSMPHVALLVADDGDGPGTRAVIVYKKEHR